MLWSARFHNSKNRFSIHRPTKDNYHACPKHVLFCSSLRIWHTLNGTKWEIPPVYMLETVMFFRRPGYNNLELQTIATGKVFTGQPNTLMRRIIQNMNNNE